MKLNLNLDWFSQNHWQKQPVHLPKLIHNFSDPISPEELAGLAMEECISSRIITPSGTEDGPFEAFSALEQKGASLLVQAVNHWHQPCSELFDLFRFLPNWRLDDLMISYSTPEGSVGAHLDQYDVFIIQGQGQRRWRVGAPLSSAQAELYHHGDEFEAVIDVVMSPGDALYIPPNTPHQGTTLEECLNYSVGFRAPSVSELLTRMADQLLDSSVITPRFCDPNRVLSPKNSGSMTPSDVSQLQNLLSDYVHSDQGKQLIATQLSEQQREMDLVEPDSHISAEELGRQLDAGAVLVRTPGLVPLYAALADEVELYIQGQLFKFSPQDKKFVQILCDSSSFTLSATEINKPSVEFLTILSRLLSDGYWYLTG